MVPTINTKGIFAFSAPYDLLISGAQQLTVVSIRSIPELQTSGENPLDNIYIPAGETEAVLLADIASNTPIVTLLTEGNEYIYVPANKLISDAKLTGVQYVEKVLIVRLGYLPSDTNLGVVTSLVNDAVYNSIGVTPDITPTDSSATIRLSETKHATLDATRNGIKTVDKSFETQYNELLDLYNKQRILIDNINQVYITAGIGV